MSDKGQLQTKSFFLQLSILSVFSIVLIVLLHFFLPSIIHSSIWLILAYNILLTAISFFLIRKGVNKGGAEFISFFMGNSAIRLLITAIILAAYILSQKSSDSYDKDSIIHFVATFFVFYMYYTVFEIKTLLSNSHRNSGES